MKTIDRLIETVEVEVTTPERGVALVTGGASGIAGATVERLAEDGMTIVVADIQREAGEAVAAAVRAAVATPCFGTSTRPTKRRLPSQPGGVVHHRGGAVRRWRLPGPLTDLS